MNKTRKNNSSFTSIWNTKQLSKFVIKHDGNYKEVRKYLERELISLCNPNINSQRTIKQSLKMGLSNECDILFYISNKIYDIKLNNRELDKFVSSNIMGFVIFSRTKQCAKTWNIDISCNEKTTKMVAKLLISAAINKLKNIGAKHIQATIAGNDKNSFVYKLLRRFGAKDIPHSKKCADSKINDVDLVIDISTNITRKFNHH